MRIPPTNFLSRCKTEGMLINIFFRCIPTQHSHSLLGSVLFWSFALSHQTFHFLLCQTGRKYMKTLDTYSAIGLTRVLCFTCTFHPITPKKSVFVLTNTLLRIQVTSLQYCAVSREQKPMNPDQFIPRNHFSNCPKHPCSTALR